MRDDVDSRNAVTKNVECIVNGGFGVDKETWMGVAGRPQLGGDVANCLIFLLRKGGYRRKYLASKKREGKWQTLKLTAKRWNENERARDVRH